MANLQIGSRGEDVIKLQQQLKSAGFDPGAADGIFGPKTQAMVKAYQASRGLAVDGIAGPITLGALSGGNAAIGTPSNVPRDETLPEPPPTLPKIDETAQPTVPTTPKKEKTLDLSFLDNLPDRTLPEPPKTTSLMDFANALNEATNIARMKAAQFSNEFLSSKVPLGTTSASNFTAVLSNLSRAQSSYAQPLANAALDAAKEQRAEQMRQYEIQRQQFQSDTNAIREIALQVGQATGNQSVVNAILRSPTIDAAIQIGSGFLQDEDEGSIITNPNTGEVVRLFNDGRQETIFSAPPPTVEPQTIFNTETFDGVLYEVERDAKTGKEVSRKVIKRDATNPGGITKFTDTQINGGAVNAGMTIAEFKLLDEDTKNVFINGDISGSKEEIKRSLEEGLPLNDILQEFENDEEIPQKVKDVLIDYARNEDKKINPPQISLEDFKTQLVSFLRQRNFEGVSRDEAKKEAEKNLRNQLGLRPTQSLPKKEKDMLEDALVEAYGRTFGQVLIPFGR